MIDSRFENRLNTDNRKYHVLNPVWDNLEADAYNIFEMIELLNDYDHRLEYFKEKFNQRIKFYEQLAVETRKESDKYTNRMAHSILEELEELKMELKL